AGLSSRPAVLQAMASGRAIVSTALGVEGLCLSPTYDAWIADTADRFTSAVALLLSDSGARVRLGARAAETADSRYDTATVQQTLDRLVRSFEGQRQPPRSRP